MHSFEFLKHNFNKSRPLQGDFMAVISMKQFLDAGVHFGHQTKRWHPKMSPYIYGIKNGVHVIDLRQTLTKLKADGSVAPFLAERWENIEPTKWRFHLKKGVKFSNGEPFTAKAVKSTFDFLSCLIS